MTTATVERVAARLMFGESPGDIEVARDRFCQRLAGRDYVYVEISVPHATEGLGEQFEEVFQRTVIAPRGSIERAVVAVAAVCDELDPGGRDVEAWEPDESPTPTAPARPEPAEAEEDSALSPAEGAPTAQADTAEPSETADDAGQEGGDDAPESSTTPAASEEHEEREALPSLRELMKDLPLDRDPSTEGIVAMPKSELVLQAFLVHFRRVLRRLQGLWQFVDELPVPDEAGLDYGGGVAEKEAARLELGELEELLVDLREDVFVYLNHTGAGWLVELDDEALAAMRELSRAMPWYLRRADWLVAAAVRHVAHLPNRGGILADAEQRRYEALDREYHRKARPADRVGWPWTDALGQPLTAQSEYAPSGELADPPKPWARSA